MKNKLFGFLCINDFVSVIITIYFQKNACTILTKESQ